MHHLSKVTDACHRVWASTSGRIATIAVGAFAAVSLVGLLFIYSGAFNVAADDPHSALVHWIAETARTRSIEVRASDIAAPPDLMSPVRIAAGGSEYAEMCSQCHLAPGMERTEISQGLYPPAPELARGISLTPAEIFWVLKHGIKLTGMPAWGPTHDDALLWNIVAFVRKLPSLRPEQYAALVKSAPESHDQMMQDMHHQ